MDKLRLIIFNCVLGRKTRFQGIGIYRIPIFNLKELGCWRERHYILGEYNLLIPIFITYEDWLAIIIQNKVRFDVLGREPSRKLQHVRGAGYIDQLFDNADGAISVIQLRRWYLRVRPTTLHDATAG